MSSSLYDAPAAEPPPGVQPNFIDPSDSQRIPLIVVNSVFMSLMLLTVIIRFYSKSLLTHTLGWDDCMDSLEILPECI